ncbi:MAG: helix-turn-helix transcriptional regulator [Acidimicrobiia bacterium]|nr:helix-turn-helix transcriptional regulator [Acidimicrobiia bacterium]
MSRRPRTDPGERVDNTIAHVRGQAGMSRNELADAVGVHYQTVGYLERGEYNPSLALALRIAAVLGRSVEELFSLHAEHPNTDDLQRGQQ